MTVHPLDVEAHERRIAEAIAADPDLAAALEPRELGKGQAVDARLA